MTVICWPWKFSDVQPCLLGLEQAGWPMSPPECCECQTKERASQAEGKRRGPVTGDVWAELKSASRNQADLHCFPFLPSGRPATPWAGHLTLPLSGSCFHVACDKCHGPGTQRLTLCWLGRPSQPLFEVLSLHRVISCMTVNILLTSKPELSPPAMKPSQIPQVEHSAPPSALCGPSYWAWGWLCLVSSFWLWRCCLDIHSLRLWILLGASQMVLVVKNPPANAG